jgi:arylsulfatase A-like enzyme
MPVSLVQVQPTLPELCGVPVPSLDGSSLVPQLRNAADVRDLPVYSEFNLQTPRAKYMLRRRRFKYTFRVNDMPELYDLQRDREEMDNLALKPEFSGTMEQMKQELFAWHHPSELA